MKAVTVLLALALVPVTLGQSSTPYRQRPVSKRQSISPAAKQLSPKEQMWCPVLKSALSGTAAAEPPMRSYILDAVAGGLSKCDPRKVRTVLVDAFTATLAMPENFEEIRQRVRSLVSEGQHPDQATFESFSSMMTKRRLQESALTHLLPVDEAKVESLLAQAEPGIGAILLGRMISRATRARTFDRAIQLLGRVRLDQTSDLTRMYLPFPYREATELMLALPPARDADKQDIFRLAMASDGEQHSLSIEGDDFASMIVRFWRHVPPSLALAAIHQVLDAAERREGTGGFIHNTASGSLGFTTEYDYRVFELLPVLRQLDEDEADRILKDSQQAQFQLKQFPNGIQSIDPTIRDTPAEDGERQGIGRLYNFSDETDQVLQAARSQVEEIGRTAQTNPRQAIAAAATLPESVGRGSRMEFPRGQAYLEIARTVVKKNHPAAKNALDAKDALAKMAESLKHAVHPYHTMDQWLDAIEVAREMNDVDLALELFRSGMEQAERLRSEDADPDDPNMALKAWWPSVSAYSRLVLAASQISPQAALEEIQKIRDAEILLLLEIRLASKNVGARTDQFAVEVNKKSSHETWGEDRHPEE